MCPRTARCTSLRGRLLRGLGGARLVLRVEGVQQIVDAVVRLAEDAHLPGRLRLIALVALVVVVTVNRFVDVVVVLRDHVVVATIESVVEQLRARRLRQAHGGLSIINEAPLGDHGQVLAGLEARRRPRGGAVVEVRGILRVDFWCGCQEALYQCIHAAAVAMMLCTRLHKCNLSA